MAAPGAAGGGRRGHGARVADGLAPAGHGGEYCGAARPVPLHLGRAPVLVCNEG